MLAKVSKVAVVLLMVSVLLGPCCALAVAADGPDSEWTQLDVGEQDWYTLQYRGHHEYIEPEEEDEETEAIWVDSSVEIRMDVEPDSGAGFSVVTPGQLRAWASGEELESSGQGTENEYDDADLTWSGSFSEPGDYYLIVEYTGTGTDSVYYRLEISGEDIAVIAPTVEKAEAAEAVAEAPPAEPTAGSGPADAIAPSSDWVPLPGGETLWYAFDYQGHHEYEEAKDEDEEAKAIWVGPNVQVLLDSEPDESITFSIWTEEQVRLWSAGEEFEPIGQGTENEFAAGDLCWCGNFAGPGRYYIVVENQGTEPGSFSLTVGGEDVTF